ncbi:MAG: hypothetical protein ABIX28_18530, partial [Vicinamibacterales bacterium]
MRDSRLGWACAAAMLLFPLTASAQATMRPERRPVVTAENERWYFEGQPITYQGGLYYPAGAPVFFNVNEMARTGDYLGIPLYVLSTRDSTGVVYVPVAGGLVRPYERRRDGEVAGTVGNAAPSFPVSRDTEATGPDAGYQAAAPPVLGAAYLSPFDPDPVVPERPSILATTGTSGRSLETRPVGPLTTALKPTGLNAFYIEFSGTRYYSAGPVVILEPASFTRAGEYHGFPVYTAADRAETIFVAVANGAPGLLSPYSTHYALLMGHDRFDRLPRPEGRKFRPLHRESCGFPSPASMLEQFGVRHWFSPQSPRDEADYAKRYCVDKDALTLPTMALRVM